MHAVDTWIGRETRQILKKLDCGWQDGYHDTRIRSTKQFFHVRNYIRKNPISAELVETAEDWDWSSWHPENSDLISRPWPWGFEQDKD